MNCLMSEDNYLAKQTQDENLLDYKLLISQMGVENRESINSFEPYNSSSPCSSESADSYPSSNSQSPADKMSWLCLQSSPCQASDQEPRKTGKFYPNQLETQQTDKVNPPFNSLDYPSECDPSFLFTDYIDQDFLTTQISLDSVETGLNSDRMTDTLKSQIVCAFQDPDYLDDPSYEPVRSSTNPVSRPKTLGLSEVGRIQGQTTQGHQGQSETFYLLASPTTPNELQQQLASADIAWMDALDVPNLSLEEIERILSTVNSLRSPEEDLTGTFNELSKAEDKCPLSDARRRETSAEEESNCPITSLPPSGNRCSLMISCSAKEDVSPNGNQIDDPDENDKLVTQTQSIDGFDSDSTLTCSEAEYYNNQIKHRKIRRTKRNRQRTPSAERSDFSSGNSESEDDLCWVEDTQNSDDKESKYTKHGWYSRLLGSQSMSRYPSYRRVRNAQADADMEPWWPRGCSRRVANDVGATITRGKGTLRKPRTVRKSPGDELVLDPERTSSDEEMSDNKIIRQPAEEKPFRYGGVTQNGPKSLSRNKSRTKRKSISQSVTYSSWRGQRRQKQMELWQFILCRLETGKQSAFQWVNRSNGVFRIVDTQAGAKEWGSYRNNKRMDYEKMARAMRFYYKDSILRKARQQLHFQFAMSYVEWATKYYESVS